MKMIMVRHASRSLHDLGDVPLNEKGHQQAERIRQLVLEGVLPTPTTLLSSPKKRAKETFLEVADALEMPIQIDPRLDERKENESSQAFKVRVQSFLDMPLSDSNERPSTREQCLMVCSHLDWLELAMVLLDSNLSDVEIASSWSNAEYRVFKFDGIWQLTAKGHA